MEQNLAQNWVREQDVWPRPNGFLEQANQIVGQNEMGSGFGLAFDLRARPTGTK